MTIKEIKYGSDEWLTAVEIREQILREPLGSRFTEQELEEEKDHIQIAVFLNNELIATAVLVPEGENLKMQRVVVLENLRNRNIGSQMIEYCENLAANKGFKSMYCHARETAVNFYSKNRYEPEGDYFDEDGIPHLKMKKKLSIIRK